jgi:SEC-C motif-containing protein
MTDHPLCPCGSGRAYAGCCAPLIDGERAAETAEELMRSRYTAYTLARDDYLLRTWHPSRRPQALDLRSAAPVKWLGLTILRTRAGGPADSEGSVEFVARYKPAGKAGRLHEISRFVKDHGQWFYVDGEAQPAS